MICFLTTRINFFLLLFTIFPSFDLACNKLDPSLAHLLIIASVNWTSKWLSRNTPHSSLKMLLVKAYHSVLDYKSKESLTQAIREMGCNLMMHATEAVSAMIKEETTKLQIFKNTTLLRQQMKLPSMSWLAKSGPNLMHLGPLSASLISNAFGSNPCPSAPGCKLNMKETSRVASFCSHPSNKREGTLVFEIPDMLQDAWFSGNPFVTNHPNACWYAGVPLILPKGYRLGMLCIVDNKPRSLLSMEDMSSLMNMASEMVRLFVQRLNQKDKLKAMMKLDKTH